jgi:hypothetical protein
MGKTDEDIRDAQITIRIPRWMRAALEDEAKVARRSIADIVVFALEEKYERKHVVKKLVLGRKKGGK